MKITMEPHAQMVIAECSVQGCCRPEPSEPAKEGIGPAVRCPRPFRIERKARDDHERSCPTVMKKNIAICARGLWPTYFLGSRFDRNMYHLISCQTSAHHCATPERQIEHLRAWMLLPTEGPVDAAKEAHRHDHRGGEMGKADVAKSELMGRFADCPWTVAGADEVARDTEHQIAKALIQCQRRTGTS